MKAAWNGAPGICLYDGHFTFFFKANPNLRTAKLAHPLENIARALQEDPL
jgi:hypothetical protein